MRLSENIKAYLAAVGAAAGYFIGVLDPTALGWSAFAHVTTVQWLGMVITVLGTFGVTWAVPNRPPAPLEVAVVEPVEVEAPPLT